MTSTFWSSLENNVKHQSRLVDEQKNGGLLSMKQTTLREVTRFARGIEMMSRFSNVNKGLSAMALDASSSSLSSKTNGPIAEKMYDRSNTLIASRDLRGDYRKRPNLFSVMPEFVHQGKTVNLINPKVYENVRTIGNNAYDENDPCVIRLCGNANGKNPHINDGRCHTVVQFNIREILKEMEENMKKAEIQRAKAKIQYTKPPRNANTRQSSDSDSDSDSHPLDPKQLTNQYVPNPLDPTKIIDQTPYVQTVLSKKPQVHFRSNNSFVARPVAPIQPATPAPTKQITAAPYVQVLFSALQQEAQAAPLPAQPVQPVLKSSLKPVFDPVEKPKKNQRVDGQEGRFRGEPITANQMKLFQDFYREREKVSGMVAFDMNGMMSVESSRILRSQNTQQNTQQQQQQRRAEQLTLPPSTSRYNLRPRPDPPIDTSSQQQRNSTRRKKNKNSNKDAQKKKTLEIVHIESSDSENNQEVLQEVNEGQPNDLQETTLNTVLTPNIAHNIVHEEDVVLVDPTITNIADNAELEEQPALSSVTKNHLQSISLHVDGCKTGTQKIKILLNLIKRLLEHSALLTDIIFNDGEGLTNDRIKYDKLFGDLVVCIIQRIDYFLKISLKALDYDFKLLFRYDVPLAKEKNISAILLDVYVAQKIISRMKSLRQFAFDIDRSLKNPHMHTKRMHDHVQKIYDNSCIPLMAKIDECTKSYSETEIHKFQTPDDSTGLSDIIEKAQNNDHDVLNKLRGNQNLLYQALSFTSVEIAKIIVVNLRNHQNDNDNNVLGANPVDPLLDAVHIDNLPLNALNTNNITELLDSDGDDEFNIEKAINDLNPNSFIFQLQFNALQQELELIKGGLLVSLYNKLQQNLELKNRQFEVVRKNAREQRQQDKEQNQKTKQEIDEHAKNWSLYDNVEDAKFLNPIYTHLGEKDAKEIGILKFSTYETYETLKFFGTVCVTVDVREFIKLEKKIRGVRAKEVGIDDSDDDGRGNNFFKTIHKFVLLNLYESCRAYFGMTPSTNPNEEEVANKGFLSKAYSKAKSMFSFLGSILEFISRPAVASFKAFTSFLRKHPIISVFMSYIFAMLRIGICMYLMGTSVEELHQIIAEVFVDIMDSPGMRFLVSGISCIYEIISTLSSASSGIIASGAVMSTLFALPFTAASATVQSAGTGFSCLKSTFRLLGYSVVSPIVSLFTHILSFAINIPGLSHMIDATKSVMLAIVPQSISSDMSGFIAQSFVALPTFFFGPNHISALVTSETTEIKEWMTINKENFMNSVPNMMSYWILKKMIGLYMLHFILRFIPASAICRFLKFVFRSLKVAISYARKGIELASIGISVIAQTIQRLMEEWGIDYEMSPFCKDMLQKGQNVSVWAIAAYGSVVDGVEVVGNLYKKSAFGGSARETTNDNDSQSYGFNRRERVDGIYMMDDDWIDFVGSLCENGLEVFNYFTEMLLNQGALGYLSGFLLAYEFMQLTTTFSVCMFRRFYNILAQFYFTYFKVLSTPEAIQSYLYSASDANCCLASDDIPSLIRKIKPVAVTAPVASE